MSLNYDRIQELFGKASALPTTPARHDYLVAACGDDPELLKEVESLLAAADRAEDFLKGPILGGVTWEDAPLRGQFAGRYRIIRKLGEGGFGEVYLAEQETPVRRPVAIKIIKARMATPEVVHRFEAERQALACMDHPNIARIYDAGTSEQGRPYFVMELVAGTPLNVFCDEQKLPTKARLELFLQVCRAAHHAHQRGIIHRDIKPANVLVTMRDGVPTPKLIDFGIAKVLASPTNELSNLTTTWQVLGTPDYMSPEQLAGGGDVDTRTDVYSLGVLGYELLTGTTPFTSHKLRKAGLDLVTQFVRETHPPKPSTRLTSMAMGELSAIAANRATPPTLLPRQLRNDLDEIVMKCLEKDCEQRFESVAELIRNVECHLDGRAVPVANPNFVRQAQKLVRRHRHAFLTGVFGFAVLAALFIWWERMPGGLILAVTPGDAEIDIDQKPVPNQGMPAKLHLAAGLHKVRIHRDEFEDEVRETYVKRGADSLLTDVKLRHNHASVSITSQPEDAAIQLAGTKYYSPISQLELNSGDYVAQASKQGYFDGNLALKVGRGHPVKSHISLERGLLWKHAEGGLQSMVIPLPGSSPGDEFGLVALESDGLAFLDAEGRRMTNGAIASGITRGIHGAFLPFEMGGEVGGVFCLATYESGAKPALEVWKKSWPPRKLWHRVFEETNSDERFMVEMCAVPGTNAHSNLALIGIDGWLRIFDSATGDQIIKRRLWDHPTLLHPRISSWRSGGSSKLGIVYSAPDASSEVDHLQNSRLIRLNLDEPTQQETVLERGVIEAGFTPDASDGIPQLVLQMEGSLKTHDPMSGKMRGEMPLKFKLEGFPRFIHLAKGGGLGMILKPAEQHSRITLVDVADCSARWTSGIESGNIWIRPEPTHAAGDNSLIVQTTNGLASIEPDTGTILWTKPGLLNKVEFDPSNGDIVASLDDRLLRLGPSGLVKWSLWLGEPVGLRIAHAHHGNLGANGAFIFRPNSFVGYCREPCELWESGGGSALISPPVVATAGNGSNAIVLQLMQGEVLSSVQRMVALNPMDGQRLWESDDEIAPNAPPALADFDNNGTTCAAYIGKLRGQPENRLIVRQMETGTLVSAAPFDCAKGWISCTPLIGDFRGTGTSDAIISSPDKPCQIALLEGRSGRPIWRVPTTGSSMGGIVACQLEGNGTRSVLIACDEGDIYALRARDGSLLWKAVNSTYSSVSKPVVNDLNGDGHPMVLLTTLAGKLVILNGQTGAPEKSPNDSGDMKISGSVVVTQIKDRKVILAPMGRLGLVAYDWPNRKELWRSPPPHPVVATPAIFHLAQTAQTLIAVGTTTGKVFLLDPATGTSRWSTKLSEKPIVAGLVARSLASDGRDDLLVASTDGHLYALNGRLIFNALREK